MKTATAIAAVLALTGCTANPAAHQRLMASLPASDHSPALSAFVAPPAPVETAVRPVAALPEPAPAPEEPAPEPIEPEPAPEPVEATPEIEEPTPPEPEIEEPAPAPVNPHPACRRATPAAFC